MALARLFGTTTAGHVYQSPAYQPPVAGNASNLLSVIGNKVLALRVGKNLLPVDSTRSVILRYYWRGHCSLSRQTVHACFMGLSGTM